MTRTLFFRIVLRKSSGITNNKPIFSQYKIFYRLVLFSCFAVHTLWAVAIFSTYFRKLKEIGVIQPIFPGHVISCDYGLTRLKNHAFKLKFFVSIFRKLNQINNIKSRKGATFENWEIFSNYYF